FDIGNGNLLAFFDFPGLDLGAYAEVLGGLHHLAISVERERWQHLKDKLDTAGVHYEQMSGSSLYFNGPDGERLELISDALGEMYGTAVLERPGVRVTDGRVSRGHLGPRDRGMPDASGDRRLFPGRRVGHP